MQASPLSHPGSEESIIIVKLEQTHKSIPRPGAFNNEICEPLQEEDD